MRPARLLSVALVAVATACASLSGLSGNGGDAGPTRHDATTDAGCVTGAMACSGAQPRVCVSGAWIDQGAACSLATPACLGGACVTCNPGARQCGGNGVETCTDAGAWSDASACDAGSTCGSGVCGGVCGPGETRCSGNGVETCGADGGWASPEACPAHTTCVSGACGGACAPGDVQCYGNTPQTCSADGQWLSGTTCVGPTFCALGSCMTEPPSCNGSATAGINDCASEAAGESCCASLEVAGVVAGQSFYRVYDVNDAGMTIPVDGGVINEAEPATVSAFRLDKYLVTVGRFRQFVNILYPGGQPASTGTLAWSPQVGSGKHTHLNGGKGLVSVGADGGTVYEQGWMPGLTQLVQPTSTALACQMGTLLPTWTDMPGSGESLPINCVTWSEAYAFCIWDGGFLPSEAEWAYAAAGGAMQREYPWGWESPGTANKYAIYNCDYPSGHGACQGLANLAPVGTAPDGAGLWGQLDLAGELYEWALDLFAPLVTPCDDCADLSAETGSRVLRGNGYESSFGFFLNHKGVDPEDRSAANGFRCARTP